MIVMFVLIGIPLTYLVLASVSLLPSDIGLFALVLANSAAWSIFHVRGSRTARNLQTNHSTETNSMKPSRAVVTTARIRRSK